MLRTRIITAAVLLPLLIGGMFFLPTIWWAFGLSPLLFAGAWEWGGLTGMQRTARQGYGLVVLMTSFALLLGVQYSDMLWIEQGVYWLAVVFWLVCVPLSLRRGWRLRHLLLSALTGWLLIVPTWFALIRLQEVPWILLAVLGVVWVADTAAYFAGHRWGRRKLAPAISPGKTWEGVAGATVAVAVYHALVWNLGLHNLMPGSSVAAALLVACLLPLSIIGDLFESLIKRQAGVKDSGTLLPGHGGVLDRIDGLTATLPLAALAVPWMLR